MSCRKIGILLFNEVEVMDFAGPFEVFSITENEVGKEKAFEVHTIARKKELIIARNGLKIQPDYDFHDAPQFDILIIPGGYGAEEIEIHNQETIDWIRSSFTQVQIMASVCTGAFLLAKAGLLDGRQATTHWMDLDRLEEHYPQVRVIRDVKFVDAFPIITSGGISAGINMSFYIVKKLLGLKVAKITAKRMEYDIDLGN
ncbi:ThiJ/PfpI domain-containing protein [Ruminiclostridium papyrosolvens DSM 2782]|uniref:ThiJ/PfpI domain-containing protein n=1 Tax=Ruminiclostridium papyrosolvens DSM 2782 TaxID=588581 RepID=F1TEX2_9FIRM|nr:DJ-1/PfpI family protein [Ruminiclostridium papyrosolvens]EGD46910.1 ThiJ/PfpI domain-containing protein [Ruminiclostridium papyrosolvens DSM 2782]WES33839.1 DJ-1/PfpI family protein [Ruminiclostridium papyrosolvens DSM 2782]